MPPQRFREAKTVGVRKPEREIKMRQAKRFSSYLKSQWAFSYGEQIKPEELKARASSHDKKRALDAFLLVEGAIFATEMADPTSLVRNHGESWSWRSVRLSKIAYMMLDMALNNIYPMCAGLSMAAHIPDPGD
jgi:hypothetical protein